MTIGQRVKQLRKYLEMSQTEFGSNINLKQAAVGMIEHSRRQPTDRVIADIVRVYGVSESWLRTGQGSMIEEKTVNEELATWAGKMLSCNDEDFKKRFLIALSALDEDEWKTIERFCRSLFLD